MIGLYREDLDWKVQGRGRGMPARRTEGCREEPAACGHFDMLNTHLSSLSVVWNLTVWTGNTLVLPSPSQGIYRIQENIPGGSPTPAGCQVDWNSSDLGENELPEISQGSVWLEPLLKSHWMN